MARVKEQSVAYTTRKKTSVQSLIKKPKQAVLKMLQNLKDDATYEDIMYELYVLEKIQRGLHDIEQGNVYSHAEVKQYLKKWLK